MPKYTVLKSFKNLETGEIYDPVKSPEIELTEKRGAEVIEKLEEFGGGFLKEVGPTAEEIELQEKEAAKAKAEKEAAEKESADKKKAEKKSEKDEK